MRAILNDLAAALGLMTRLPVPASLGGAEPNRLARSVWAFPLVGLLVGGLGALVLLVAHGLGLATSVAAGLAVAAQILVTGAIHEDGLADVADGFGAGGDADRTLEIMRDSRVGTYGAIALVVAIGLRWTSLAALAPYYSVAALLVAGALGRIACAGLLALLQPARTDGLGVSVVDPPKPALAVALSIGAATCLLFLPAAAAALALAVTGAVVALMAWLAWRRIRGYTGDVLGAGEQAGEVAVLVALAAIL